MDWTVVVGALLTGGVLKEVVGQISAGVRQRRRARGEQEGQRDVLTRSRLWWIERTYAVRKALIDNGGTPPPLDEKDDPYVIWRTEQDKVEP